MEKICILDKKLKIENIEWHAVGVGLTEVGIVNYPRITLSKIEALLFAYLEI